MQINGMMRRLTIVEVIGLPITTMVRNQEGR